MEPDKSKNVLARAAEALMQYARYENNKPPVMAVNVTSRHGQHASHLLRLPAELRNRIYEEALTSDKPIWIVRGGRFKERWQAPALLQTCYVVRTEASSIYRGNNSFSRPWHYGEIDVFDGVLAKWLSVFPTSTRALVREVCIEDNFVYKSSEVAGRIEKCLAVLAQNGVTLQPDALFVELMDSERRKGWINISGVQSRLARFRT